MSESSPDLVRNGPPMQEQGASPLASLVVPLGLSPSRPGTAATSMLTIVPNEDEKNDESSRRPSEEHAEASSPAAPEQPIPQTPQISLKFLLVPGSRKVMSFDATTSISRVKELVWNAWQSDWQDPRPPTPSYLWIVHLGKVLQDDNTLEGLSFPSWTTPSPAISTVVHLWIRNAPPPAVDESALKKKTRRSTMRANSTRQLSLNGTQGQATDTTADEHGGGCCAGCVIC